MPQVIARDFKAKADRAARAAQHKRNFSSQSSIRPKSEIVSGPNPSELVYNIRTCKFRLTHHSLLAPHEDLVGNEPLTELVMTLPPLLVDGRRMIVQIPRWKTKIDFLWRSSDGKFTKVHQRVVRLPRWIWVTRNFSGGFKEVWIE
jgi:hypothetical protein